MKKCLICKDKGFVYDNELAQQQQAANVLCHCEAATRIMKADMSRKQGDVRCYETRMKLQGKVKVTERQFEMNWSTYKRPPVKLSELKRMVRK